MMTGASTDTRPLEVVIMAGLCLEERLAIDACLREDVNMSWTVIARRVGRHRTTVFREVTRNGDRAGYRPALAQKRADRQRQRPKPFKLVSDPVLRAAVTADLKAGYSPAAISRRLAVAAGSVVSAETIYRAVYTTVIDVNPKDCLRTRRPRRKPRHRRSWGPGNYLGDYTPVSARPVEVEDRIEPGHWEGDLIIGRYNQSAMITLVERVSRYTHLIALPDGYGTRAVIPALISWLDGLPAVMRQSLTWDQGGELTRWPDLVGHVGTVYFCEARKPWQRGTNEQNNRTLRFWLPRTADLTTIDPGPGMAIINTQPRRVLNWATPLRIYNNHLTVH
jgi:IS30 family transposase